MRVAMAAWSWPRTRLPIGFVLIPFFCLSPGPAPAAETKAPGGWFSAQSMDVEISARLIIDKQAVIDAVGSDLKRQYSLVELKVTPKGNYPVTLSRDDFLLRSERDNQHATADSPDLVAGPAVLVLTDTGATRPGYASPGMPTAIPGLSGPKRKKNRDKTPEQGAVSGPEVQPPQSEKSSALLIAALQAKELPLGETRKSVSGYLYFPVDPQQKAKNFYLSYKGPNGVCEIRFK